MTPELVIPCNRASPSSKFGRLRAAGSRSASLDVWSAPVITRNQPDALLVRLVQISLFHSSACPSRTEETLEIKLSHLWLSFVNRSLIALSFVDDPRISHLLFSVDRSSRATASNDHRDSAIPRRLAVLRGCGCPTVLDGRRSKRGRNRLRHCACKIRTRRNSRAG